MAGRSQAVPPDPDAAGGGSRFRQRLLDGMAEAIRQRGYRDTTLADIVRYARTSRRTFYEHFPSKQACFLALLRESNAIVIRRIADAVDPRSGWREQVRQAIYAWLDSVRAEPELMLSWIREIPALGEQGRRLEREFHEAFITLIRTLTDTEELRAAGVRPASRLKTLMLLGGLRELVAVTVEDGGDLADLAGEAIECTTALLGPATG